MSKTGDSPCSSHNTLASVSKQEKVYQFIENAGKFGGKHTYKCLNGKIIKSSEGIASSVTFFLKDLFKQIFLPVGFPESVSDDYVSYQIWDTIQAFCSTITGTFTTQSILKSVGVGDQTATALGAAITWIIKDGSGLGGRILFVWWHGNSLDSDCKTWRMFADIINDCALTIEFTLPYWALKSNTGLLCLTSVMKSIVGVAGGATRAAITQHQAVQGNMADVSAKDGSQETCVNLLASILGIFLLTYFENNEVYLAVIFAFLTVMHIFANYKAIHGLTFKHLNLPRFLIVFNNYLKYDAVANPTVVNKAESIFFPSLIKTDRYLCGFTITMGSSLQKPFKTLHADRFNLIMKAFKGQKYIIVPEMKKRILYVAFDQSIDSELMIRAYFHAIMLGKALLIYNNILLDSKTKRHIHHVTPTQRLHNLMKKLVRSPVSENMEMFTLEHFIIFNVYIHAEALSFFTGLSINNWDLSRNSLPVGEWRCNLLNDDADCSTTKKDN